MVVINGRKFLEQLESAQVENSLIGRAEHVISSLADDVDLVLETLTLARQEGRLRLAIEAFERHIEGPAHETLHWLCDRIQREARTSADSTRCTASLEFRD